MSVKAAEVFPDLHHKMSKKIAQLTKVIYHLNTRNEDHQADLELIQSNHQVEIQQILKDAANRINNFKEAVESKQGELNTNSKLTALQSKYEKEREAAKKEYSILKEKSASREANIASEFQKKYEALQGSVEDMNKKFLDKVKSFEASTETLKEALKAARAESSSSLQDSKAAFEKELADLVKSSNEKYQKMLMEQMLLQESLREEMQRRIEETKEEVSSSLKREHEAALGKLRAKLNGDKQEELMTLKREHEHEVQKVKEDLMGKLEKALQSMKTQKEMYLNQLQGKEGIEKELREQIAALQSGFSSTSGLLEEQIESLKTSLQREKEVSSALTQQLEEKTSALAEEEQVTASLKTEVAGLQGHVAELEGDLQRLREELQQRGTLGAEAEKQLKKQLVDADKEASVLRKEIVKLTDTVTGLKTDLSKKESAAVELAAKNKAKLKALEEEVSSLQQQLKDALRNASKDSDKTMKEMNDLRKQMAKMEAEHKKQLEDKNVQHQAALAEAASKHKSECVALQRRLDEAEKSGASREQSLQEQLKRMEAEHAAELQQLRGQHARQAEETRAEHAEDVDKLNAKISALETQLSELSSKADGERGSLKSEMTRLEAKTKKLQQELDAKKKEGERAESVCNGLKTQVESLREELKATQKAFRDKMDLSLAKLDGEWTERVEKLKAEHEAALAALGEEKDCFLKEQLQEQADDHQAEIESLKSLLQKEANESGEELMKLEAARVTLEQQLAEEKKAHSASQLAAAERLQTTMKDAEARRLREIADLTRSMSGDAEDKMNALLKKHSEELAQLEATSTQQLQATIDKYEAEKKQAQLDAQKHLKNTMLDLQAKHSADKKKALDEMDADYTAQIRKLQDAHKTAMDGCQAEIDDLKRSLSLNQDNNTDLQRQLEALHQEKARREEQFVLERDQILRGHDQDLRAEREKGERLVIEVTQKAANDLQASKQEFRNALRQQDERIKELEDDLDEMHQRYQNRESRQEDLREIEELQRQMVDKDRLVAKTIEEMQYFKREMLNREESYNTKFNAAPNVGVMNVLKTKDKAKSGPGKKTTARHPVPQNNGMSSGPSLGVLGGK